MALEAVDTPAGGAALLKLDRVQAMGLGLDAARRALSQGVRGRQEVNPGGGTLMDHANEADIRRAQRGTTQDPSQSTEMPFKHGHTSGCGNTTPLRALRVRSACHGHEHSVYGQLTCERSLAGHRGCARVPSSVVAQTCGSARRNYLPRPAWTIRHLLAHPARRPHPATGAHMLTLICTRT